jgi:UDP-glucose 4-epimerase
MNIGVVGGNGFLGKKLVLKLLQESSNRIILFQRSQPVIDLKEFSNVVVVFETDLLNEFENSFSIDVLYYLASDSIPATSWNNPVFELQKNITPFINYTQFCIKHGLKKIIYTSSAGTIYGASKRVISERNILKPHSPYGITKATIEYYLEFFRNSYSVNYDILRISNIYGPGQDTTKGLGLINTLLENHLSNRSSSIYGLGENIRNYIFLDDVIDVLFCSLSSTIKQSGIYNVSSDENYTINEVINIIETSLNIDLNISYLPKRDSDNPFICISNKKIKRKFPIINFTSLEKGIQETFINLKLANHLR